MFHEGNLVLYKNRPCVVVKSGDKAEIRTPEGETVRIRDKDAELLHPGPVSKFDPDAVAEGDFETARQMTQGETVTVSALCDLVFGSRTPEAAWACAREILSGERFSGSLSSASALSDAQMAENARKRVEKESKERDRADFALRAKRLELKPEDSRFVSEIEAYALGKSDKTQVLKEAGIGQERAKAHEFLLKAGVWTVSKNPWPERYGMPAKPVPDRPWVHDDSGRVDLTGMEAYAIDNEWSNDPDDAISFHDGTVYVHVADPASSLKTGDSEWEEARSRAATFYDPEGTVPMLPLNALPEFALGLSGRSRALTFRIFLDDALNVSKVDIFPSFVGVTRLSYGKADSMLVSGALAELSSLASGFQAKREANGAVSIEIPEIHLSARDGVPEIRPVERYRSQAVVREMMLMAGEAAAKWAFLNSVPFPFYTQDAPGEGSVPEGLAGEFAKRRLMRAGSVSSEMSAHRGLGLGLYTQVTSPLRRFADLLAHAQIRAFLSGGKLLSKDDIVDEIGRAQTQSSRTRQAERSSDLHWQCAWLLSRPQWTGDAVVAGHAGKNAILYIPEIGLETRVPAERDLTLNETVRVTFKGADITKPEARFSL